MDALRRGRREFAPAVSEEAMKETELRRRFRFRERDGTGVVIQLDP
jgi:hypothetical protein